MNNILKKKKRKKDANKLTGVTFLHDVKNAIAWNKTRYLFLSDPRIKDKYTINITAPESKRCLNCNNPVKKPDKEIDLCKESHCKEGEQVNPAQAV